MSSPVAPVDLKGFLDPDDPGAISFWIVQTAMKLSLAESLVRMELESDSLWWQPHGRAEGFARGPLLAAERQSDLAAITRDVRTTMGVSAVAKPFGHGAYGTPSC